MTLDEFDPACDLSDPIQFMADGQFMWGALQARVYDPREAIWPQPFLAFLYEKTRLSGRRHPKPFDIQDRATLGPLPMLFCGMANLGIDSICSYLSQRAVCVAGEWREEKFAPLGYCFPSSPVAETPYSQTVPSNSVFAGYIIFSEIWRKPQQTVLMYLCLAWLFHTFKLGALHGQRYERNHLTARWTQQFGFKDNGTLPCCMADEPGGPLAPSVFSTLMRADFEERLRHVLVKARSMRNG